MSPVKCFTGIWAVVKSREGWQFNQNKNPQEVQTLEKHASPQNMFST